MNIFTYIILIVKYVLIMEVSMEITKSQFRYDPRWQIKLTKKMVDELIILFDKDPRPLIPRIFPKLTDYFLERMYEKSDMFDLMTRCDPICQRTLIYFMFKDYDGKYEPYNIYMIYTFILGLNSCSYPPRFYLETNEDTVVKRYLSLDNEKKSECIKYYIECEMKNCKKDFWKY